ncbi:hypothetical protein C491_06873 [Natronococcus amylolyticus DSM 10524]|uniref:Uncharacterized protein n=1 Tax=Natronococcus amylolyticus DSM 10524 TaxID=1227497 RepID=L9XFS6_9EURY|nr:hypothetical protein [Natronococcus amylolyticus]ELY59513.1 hypothetical protein C491_06873 [Natronococcus amylolyticus DSM 10524]
MGATEPIQWRRDPDTSRTVRLLWSLGVGTFFAVTVIIVFWRVFDMATQVGGQSIVAAALVALLITALAVAVSDDAERQLERIFGRLSVSVPSGTSLSRARDATLGTVAMVVLIGSLMIVGRIVSQQGLLGGVGAGPFTGLAALSLPLALVAILLASFLRSVGAYNPDERTVYLYDPDQSIDLDLITDASVRQIGDVAIVNFDYAQPDGRYVQGPRRIVVPPRVAREIVAAVDAR